MTASDLTPRDLERLAVRGIPAAEAERQLALLRRRPAPPPIVRPCTPGDGIERLEPDDHPALLARWREAASAGRLRKFVPASGAATRMFAGLRSDDGSPTATAVELFARRAEFAFADALKAVAEPRDGESEVATVLRALLDRDGLGLAELPKALIPFHAYPDGSRTALVEHLVEAAGYAAAGGRTVRVHFTVTADHQERIARRVERDRAALEQRFDAPLTVTFSVQDPATDTLSVNPDGAPFRDAAGALVLRPAGHGALLANLQRLADGAAAGRTLAVIKNIDNIQPEHRQEEVVQWKRLLIGRLVQVQEALDRLETRIAAGGPDASAAADELAALLRLEPRSEDRVEWAADRLRRPLRVCGMVRNTGEPGGGPFWVRGGDERATPQIVEAAQVDLDDPSQRAAWEGATHFNPVDLVCSLRDRRGQPYDLGAFVDPEAAFVSRKVSDDRPLWALERPGLWNGAMAGWNTLFVEVPAATFAPVKTVFDLLRPEHQPPGAAVR